MKLEDGKLIINEAELDLVKHANMMASPSLAGVVLQNSSKRLNESAEAGRELEFYIECILAYRKKNYEVK